LIPQVLHVTSDRVPLVGMQRAFHRRNARVLAGWKIRVWSDADNDALIHSEFPQYLDAYRLLPHGVMRADVVRLVYMHALGGWYADTDYEWFKAPPVDQVAVLPYSRDNMLGNAVFGSRAGHPFWALALDALFAQPGLIDSTVLQIEDRTGPGFMTRLLPDAQALGDMWLPPRAYFHAPVTSAGGDAFGVHHTRGSWRANPLRWKVQMMRRRLTRSVKRVLPG
jgi:mannosyltransferase OCH1-like enzyme